MTAVESDVLVIFTRYPEPGAVKTRLIPALGADGAAALHRQMAEQTLEQARALPKLRTLAIEVWFTGGSTAQMQAWLGADVIYHPQPEGGLGHRMAAAFQTMFGKGYRSAVIIGTDCPDLNTERLAQSFDALLSQPLVLGPATDGGYYLIGLQRLVPELFVDIAWSTANVLAQTLAIAQRLELKPLLLPVLTDIDIPSDLQQPSVQSLLDARSP